MSESAGGLQPDSPMPTTTRAANSCQKLRANAVTAVAELQISNASAMMLTRLPLSAQRAIGMPKVV